MITEWVEQYWKCECGFSLGQSKDHWKTSVELVDTFVLGHMLSSSSRIDERVSNEFVFLRSTHAIQKSTATSLDTSDRCEFERKASVSTKDLRCNWARSGTSDRMLPSLRTVHQVVRDVLPKIKRRPIKILFASMRFASLSNYLLKGGMTNKQSSYLFKSSSVW